MLPSWIVNRLRRGLKVFGKQMHGYLTEESNLIGYETRTSSPIRIPRDPKVSRILSFLDFIPVAKELVLLEELLALHWTGYAARKLLVGKLFNAQKPAKFTIR